MVFQFKQWLPREAAGAIAMKMLSYIMATLVRYPLQKCYSITQLKWRQR